MKLEGLMDQTWRNGMETPDLEKDVTELPPHLTWLRDAKVIGEAIIKNSELEERQRRNPIRKEPARFTFASRGWTLGPSPKRGFAG